MSPKNAKINQEYSRLAGRGQTLLCPGGLAVLSTGDALLTRGRYLPWRGPWGEIEIAPTAPGP